MLKEIINDGFGYDEAHYENCYNCCEKILYAANDVYNIGLDANSLHVASGFGAGLFMGSACGGICGATMVIGLLGTNDTQHRTTGFKERVNEMLSEIEEREGSLLCKDLKDTYFDQYKCRPLLVSIAEMLDKYYVEIQNKI